MYRNRVQTGVSMWKGPMKYNNIWFDKFPTNPNYDIAAIGKKLPSMYFFSILSSFKNILFAFDDGVRLSVIL